MKEQTAREPMANMDDDAEFHEAMLDNPEANRLADEAGILEMKRLGLTDEEIALLMTP